jgi:dTDP-glucose pyrophosphorylase
MNILILAAGKNNTSAIEKEVPLCMTEYNDIPLLEYLFETCLGISNPHFIFAFNNLDILNWHLDSVVHLLDPSAVILEVNQHTCGAACTSLLAIDHINNDDELLIISANQLLDLNLSQVIKSFKDQNYDAGTIVFDSLHPRYSYVKLDGDGFIVEAAEKKPISRFATAGVYWFSKGKLFVNAAKSMISKGASVEGKFYICPTFNEMILWHSKMGVVKIESQKYKPLKTERQVQIFETKFDQTK